MTQIVNHLYCLLCVAIAALANIPPDWVDLLAFLPVSDHVKSEIKIVVTGLAGAALWVKAHQNLFIYPDGTSVTSSRWDGTPPHIHP